MNSKALAFTNPNGWRNGIIGDVADFVRGVTYQKSDARNQAEDGYIPLLRATNIGNESLTHEEFVFVPKMVVKPEQMVRINDMVIAASSGSISVVGKSAPVLVGFEATFGAFCAVLRPKKDISHNFFRLYVQSPTCRETWSNLARGTNINNLKREQVLTTEIPLPPLDEQEKIAQILDEQLSRLDAALVSVQVMRDKAVQFRRSLLHAAFTGALTGHSMALGALPDGWKKATIADVADIAGGRTPTKLEQRLADSKLLNRNIPFFKVGDMNTALRYMSESRVYFAESETTVFGMEILKSGTVVFPKRGGAIATNKKRILEIPGAIDVNCMGVTSNGVLHEKLLYWYFESFNLSSIADGTAIPQINIKQTSALEIAFPINKGEQIKLLNEIEAQISKSEAIVHVIDEVEKKSRAFRRSLLHAAFIGDLTKEWREGIHV